ncbi:hypothetical protein RI049_09710 [Cedecea neteri]|uniref:hypothetical protein n=1 Tax=Cedecea neteri TaxID=158822 RepID=UPI002AA69CC7|nr:hypothetical protein [Cedecea neteri]WPU24989.1 hypothetical protein RI049_09710 [Cedecea neteri]
MPAQDSQSLEKFIRDLHISRVALERLTVSMFRILTPEQLDAVRELSFNQSSIASDTIPAEKVLLSEYELAIQQRLLDLLSQATPRK